MTTEGEQQGAVCGACGETRYDCVCRTFIPAPVVPGDERCAYPGCGHPRGSMFHAERFTGRHDFVVEPAPPTPSLEEAREAVINAALLPFTPAGEPLRTYVTDRVDKLEAAARAEVIREVEAALEASPVNWAGVLGPEAAIEIVRALSQGGGA